MDAMDPSRPLPDLPLEIILHTLKMTLPPKTSSITNYNTVTELVPFMLVSRTGRISFNRKAVELMGAGDRECAVTLLQDSRRPRDWYMRPGEGGFPLRGTKSYRMFQHTALAAKILDSLSFTGERLRIRIAGPTPPTNYLRY